MRIPFAPVSCVLFAAPSAILGAEPAFELGLAGPERVKGPAGTAVRASYLCTLTRTGAGAGAQGWTVYVRGSGLRFLGITTEGTDAALAFRDGSERNEVGNQDFGTPEGYAYSSVQLSADGGAALPGPTSTIARIDVEIPVPGGPGEAVLQHAEGFFLGGAPGRTVVLQGGVEHSPALGEARAQVIDTSCASQRVNLGFSARRVSSPVPFEGVIGEEGGRGRLAIGAPQGGQGEAHVYACIASDMAGGGGVSAWELAILLEGLAYVASATGEGTAADGAKEGGFQRTEVIDFATGVPLERGDSNGDGDLDFADPVWTLLALFRSGLEPGCEDAADANDDGRIDVSDPIHALRYLFLGGPAPPPPFPGCGTDPDTGADGLDCDAGQGACG
ncbi:MAG: hypothetical protein HY721_07385 [Planctomycetes bacterium]|nr:hypothetical protein [Planctomycetota bacterium]